MFETPVSDNDDNDGCDADDDDVEDDDFVDAQRGHFTVSVSFMDGAAALFEFARRPEEHDLRMRVYDEFGLSGECVDAVFTQGGCVLGPLAFVLHGAPVCAVKRSVGAGEGEG